MSSINVFGFYGTSNSGKTTLITKLTKKLTQKGWNIAVIKKTDKQISMDTTEKDTWKYHQAGASFCVFSSKKETTYLQFTLQDESTIINIISLITPVDIIFIEGSTDPTIPKIRIGDVKERKQTIYHYIDNEKEVFDFITQQLKKSDLKQNQITLQVNGKIIPLTEFPASFIEHTLKGMIQTLKGVEIPIQTINLTISTK